MTTIGLDIGGSHISVAQVVWDGSQAKINAFHEADVDTHRSAEEIIADWTDLIRKSARSQPDIQLGIAMPGPYDYPNGISLIKDQGKMKSLYGLSVKNLLAEKLQIDPVQIVFTNDAEAFLLGESLAGAGRGFKNSIGLTLGTGLGSAFKMGDTVNDAKLWTAPFRDGIAEDYLGTGWIRRAAEEKLGLEISGLKDLLSGDFDSEAVEEILAEFGTTLGEFLSPYIIQMNCQGVVIGGKIARAANRFLPYTHAYLESVGNPIQIRISELEEKAAMIGACHPFLAAKIVDREPLF
ncbi:ROK family protein [Algoriphagus terrigena]|uniref:ROK family protein n=1 Tax=Algoriphagus terrigena TaxID=344884 RepID=UPI0004173970|nr:ROK family protein [Algoriphagus terrigena]